MPKKILVLLENKMAKRKLQVFVSSTYHDLLLERQAAVAAILKAGHIPAGMELFTAGDTSQWDTIKRWIDECDVYMLILGGRYGSVEPTSGVSYTELEYDYACQQGKPLFATVIKEEALEAKVKTIGLAATEQSNPQALKLFRAKVLSNISSFFEDDRDIRLCVHESLADFRDNPLILGWIYAGDVEDTKPLNDEIARLSDENSRLKAALSKAESAPREKSVKEAGENLDELIKLLMEIEIKVPAEVTADKTEKTLSILNIVAANSEVLINGVTDATNVSAGEKFYYSNICPKLMVYGLALNERVPGVRYRRSFLSPKGIALLAEVERRRAKYAAAKKEKKPIDSRGSGKASSPKVKAADSEPTS